MARHKHFNVMRSYRQILSAMDENIENCNQSVIIDMFQSVLHLKLALEEDEIEEKDYDKEIEVIRSKIDPFMQRCNCNQNPNIKMTRKRKV